MDAAGQQVFAEVGQDPSVVKRKEAASVTVGVRLRPGDLARLDAAVLRTPFAKRSSLAREALLKGLALMERKR